MRKLLTLAVSVLAAATAVAQTPSSKEFNERYQLLVSKLGPSGVGIETLLGKWEAAYPDDADMLLGKFTYYFSKSQSSAVVAKPQDKFLGEKPVLTLKDTLGNPVNYFQVTDYDDELFGMSQKSIEKAIQLNPDRLDLRFLKVAALTGYEKESPDMALSNLKSLIIYNETQHPNWVYPGYEKVDEELFSTAIQEYCFLFFKYATPVSYEAFKEISETMLSYHPSDVLYLDNVGSYWLVVKHDYKQAAKYYNKVLKIKQDDITAIKNMILLARNTSNTKLEKKYLPLLVKYSDSESERLSAKARLEALSIKK